MGLYLQSVILRYFLFSEIGAFCLDGVFGTGIDCLLVCLSYCLLLSVYFQLDICCLAASLPLKHCLITPSHIKISRIPYPRAQPVSANIPHF